MVHERFTAALVQALRQDYPGVTILAHPECPPEVVAEADYTGSTADMSAYVGRVRPPRVVLLTECWMSDNVSVHYPDIESARPGKLRPHMKRITLPKIRRALETMQQEVNIDQRLAARARCSVERMLEGPVVASLPMVMIEPAVRAALLEDLGRAGDLTTDAIVPAEASARTALVARQTA